MDDREFESRRATLGLVVQRGREPGLVIQDGDSRISLTEKGLNLLSQMGRLTEILDGQTCTNYRNSLEIQKAKFLDPDLTPSARILEAMHEHDDNFFNFALECAAQIGSHFRDRTLSVAGADGMSELARDSLKNQRDLEAADSTSFAEFLDGYFSQ